MGRRGIGVRPRAEEVTARNVRCASLGRPRGRRGGRSERAAPGGRSLRGTATSVGCGVFSPTTSSPAGKVRSADTKARLRRKQGRSVLPQPAAIAWRSAGARVREAVAASKRAGQRTREAHRNAARHDGGSNERGKGDAALTPLLSDSGGRRPADVDRSFSGAWARTRPHTGREPFGETRPRRGPSLRPLPPGCGMACRRAGPAV